MKSYFSSSQVPHRSHGAELVKSDFISVCLFVWKVLKITSNGATVQSCWLFCKKREKVKLQKRQTIIVDKAFALKLETRNWRNRLENTMRGCCPLKQFLFFAGRETEYTHGCFSVDHLSKNLLSAWVCCVWLMGKLSEAWHTTKLLQFQNKVTHRLGSLHYIPESSALCNSIVTRFETLPSIPLSHLIKLMMKRENKTPSPNRKILRLHPKY